MPITVETTLYTFAELDSDAKEKARDWFREGIETDELADYDDWETIAGILGVEFATRRVPLMGGGTRNDPVIYWSGFSSQGDGASWEGSYSYAKQAPKRIRAHAPQDKELHRIADELQAIQRRNFYRLEARVTTSGHYSHSGTMRVEQVGDNFASDTAAESALETLLRDFADWIYRQLEAQWDYLNSEEAVDESILANEYTFDERGNREG